MSAHPNSSESPSTSRAKASPEPPGTAEMMVIAVSFRSPPKARTASCGAVGGAAVRDADRRREAGRGGADLRSKLGEPRILAQPLRSPPHWASSTRAPPPPTLSQHKKEPRRPKPPG